MTMNFPCCPYQCLVIMLNLQKGIIKFLQTPVYLVIDSFNNVWIELSFILFKFRFLSGGRWNPNNQDLLVLAAFPCHGFRTGSDANDKTGNDLAEAKVRKKMTSAGLSLVGWYHSHPSTSSHPTLADIKNQFKYQQVAEEECPDKPPGKSHWVCIRSMYDWKVPLA